MERVKDVRTKQRRAQREGKEGEPVVWRPMERILVEQEVQTRAEWAIATRENEQEWKCKAQRKEKGQSSARR